VVDEVREDKDVCSRHRASELPQQQAVVLS
jgi:hypothetical protein